MSKVARHTYIQQGRYINRKYFNNNNGGYNLFRLEYNSLVATG